MAIPAYSKKGRYYSGVNNRLLVQFKMIRIHSGTPGTAIGSPYRT